jgi:hypothetical protein
VREPVDEQRRRPHIDHHVRAELIGAELAKAIPGEARGIVDEKPRRRTADRRSEDALGALRIGEIRDDLTRTLRHVVLIVMNMGDDRPSVFDQRTRNGRSHTLPSASDYGGSGLICRHCEERSDEAIQAAQGWIASLRSQ